MKLCIVYIFNICTHRRKQTVRNYSAQTSPPARQRSIFYIRVSQWLNCARGNRFRKNEIRKIRKWTRAIACKHHYITGDVYRPSFYVLVLYDPIMNTTCATSSPD